jgi:hypothetical protein
VSGHRHPWHVTGSATAIQPCCSSVIRIGHRLLHASARVSGGFQVLLGENGETSGQASEQRANRCLLGSPGTNQHTGTTIGESIWSTCRDDANGDPLGRSRLSRVIRDSDIPQAKRIEPGDALTARVLCNHRPHPFEAGTTGCPRANRSGSWSSLPLMTSAAPAMNSSRHPREQK